MWAYRKSKNKKKIKKNKNTRKHHRRQRPKKKQKKKLPYEETLGHANRHAMASIDVDCVNIQCFISSIECRISDCEHKKVIPTRDCSNNDEESTDRGTSARNK